VLAVRAVEICLELMAEGEGCVDGDALALGDGEGEGEGDGDGLGSGSERETSGAGSTAATLGEVVDCELSEALGLVSPK
jgi:hypothetical protein